MRRGSNLPAVGTYNQTLVLDLIRRAPDGLSRTELAERTGLSAQTLSNVARRLVEAEMISEGAPIIAGKGKPRTPLHLNAQARYAVGVHLDPAVDTVVLVDLGGRIVAHREFSPHVDAPPAELVNGLARRVNSLLDEANVHRNRVLGIGIAVPGPIDSRAGVVLHPPLLTAWREIPLRDDLAAATGLAVIMEKDVVAAMVGELFTGSDRELSEALYFYYGAGVGAGLAVDGTPVHGRTGNAGDIAHLVVEPDGPPCECGQRGCLGVAVAPERVVADGEGIDISEVAAPSELRARLARLAQRAVDGDGAAVAVFERTAASIARAMVLMNNLLDADVVVIGGPIWASISNAVSAPLARALEQHAAVTTTLPIAMYQSARGTDVTALGAASLVLDSAFTARPADLMIHAD
ncbi:MAG: ROK family transcriptional regulator [Microbacterium hominis]|jgi:predicted NBD/HSP70 family sugar kinase|uniref:ROK family transcriptional regulator n=1 Tax=Microbacterium aurum TaxID=36805 RepID=UPI00248E75D0|nr:ROK family transcriptional regulator [Microbacterium aurum]MBZ6371168.1 ROK family transcriptional regulator [Microbacterium hominis]